MSALKAFHERQLGTLVEPEKLISKRYRGYFRKALAKKLSYKRRYDPTRHLNMEGYIESVLASKRDLYRRSADRFYERGRISNTYRLFPKTLEVNPVAPEAARPRMIAMSNDAVAWNGLVAKICQTSAK